MNATFDSVYPDFLRAGLGKLAGSQTPRELLSLFAALEHFRHDLHAQDTVAGILEVSRRYIFGLDRFEVIAFYLVNPSDYSFELADCSDDLKRSELDAVVQDEIQKGRFAWAVRQNAPVAIRNARGDEEGAGVLHVLALSNQVLGMFVGLTKSEPMPAQEIATCLLSLLLGACADALATLKKTTQLTSQIKTLSGLLPICAWCKKVRDDRGYWEKIEFYVRSRTDASFSHSICPDCAQSVMGKVKK